jgi:hypothetical protein
MQFYGQRYSELYIFFFIAAEKHISTLELVLFMLVVNIDRLKRDVSMGN